MNQEDFATTPSERQRIWTFSTTHMSRRNAFPPNRKHGIEKTTPKIHELVLMDSHTELKYWLTRHPEDIENSYRQKTPLLVAIKHNSYKCFKILLEHDADVEKSNSKNETALVTAVRLHRINMIEDLIYKGATIYSGDRLARTITEILISRDDVNSIRFVHIYKKNLLEHDLVNQEFPLTLAISHQARNCIDYILSQNPKVESFLINRKFSCPISVAIRRNDIKTIRALVELDRFQHIVNTKVHKSLSYIHLAVEKNRHEIADILLYHGAHVNLQDNNGNTPAHFVNDIPTLRVLISHGARLELGNRNNETPIMAAEKDGRNAVYQYLRLYNHENRKKVYKTLDTRFYYNNSDRIEKAIAAMNIMSDETSQKGNYEDMPDLEEIPPIKHIPIPPRKVNENIYPTRTEMSRLDDGAPSLKLRNFKRLIDKAKSKLPPPPGYRRDYSLITSESDSDIEKNIIADNKITPSENEDDDDLNELE